MCVCIKSHENTFPPRESMANSFFGFNNPHNEQEEGLHDDFDFDFEDEEEEYDALNDETFGADATEGDWEHDHEKLAELTEKSRVHHSSYNGSTEHEDLELEAALGQLVLDDINDDRDHEKVDKKNKSSKNNLVYSSSAPSVFPSPWSTKEITKETNNSLPDLPPGKTVCTVEELERQLISQSRTANQRVPVSSKHPECVSKDVKGKVVSNQDTGYLVARSVGRGHALRQNGMVMVRPFLQQAGQGVGILPRPPMPGPGMAIPPEMRHLQQQQQNRFLVPAPDFHLFPPPPPPPFVIRQHFQPPCGRLLLGPYPRQGFHSSDAAMFRPMMHHNNLYNSGFRDRQYVPGLRHQEPYYKHRDNSFHGGYRPSQNLHRRVEDEYAGMMSDREKMWLQNIQHMQLNTSPPHVDDYYYTIFSSRQADKKSGDSCRNRERRDSYNKEQGASKVYTPAQFENSLGKLQVGSVTAPRKIIDMDVVHQEGMESMSAAAPRDMRKLKQILLEVERLYLLLLQLEDLSSPMPELREAVQDSKEVLQQKILTTMLAEDWFVNILSFHKGKKLFVRFLNHVTDSQQMSTLWARLLGGLVTIVRHDPDSAGIMLKMFPFFSRWLQGATPPSFVELASSLVRAEEQRRSKRSVFMFMLGNRFGISALAAMLKCAQTLYASLDSSDQATWGRLLHLLVDALENVSNETPAKLLLQPLDPVALSDHFKSCCFDLSDDVYCKLMRHFCPSL